jgi:hypothetical protein
MCTVLLCIESPPGDFANVVNSVAMETNNSRSDIEIPTLQALGDTL